jgi:hypothetical protein
VSGLSDWYCGGQARIQGVWRLAFDNFDVIEGTAKNGNLLRLLEEVGKRPMPRTANTSPSGQQVDKLFYLKPNGCFTSF